MPLPGWLRSVWDRLRGEQERPEDMDEERLVVFVEHWLGAGRAAAVSRHEMKQLRRLVNTWERSGRFGEARALAERALVRSHECFPVGENVWLATRLVWLTAKASGLDAAEAVLKEQRTMLGESADARILEGFDVCLGSLREWAGDLPGALDAWSGGSGSGSAYRQLEDLPPVLAISMGTVLIDLERFDDAAARFESTTAKLPPGILQLFLGKVERERGDFGAAADRLARAEEAFDAVGLPPQASERLTLLHARGRLLARQHSWEQAESQLLDALIHRADVEGEDAAALVPILCDLGLVWAERGDESEAAKAVNRSLTLAQRHLVGAVKFADAEYAFARVRGSVEPAVALAKLAAAEERLRYLPPSNHRRVRLGLLRSELGS